MNSWSLFTAEAVKCVELADGCCCCYTDGKAISLCKIFQNTAQLSPDSYICRSRELLNEGKYSKHAQSGKDKEGQV